MGLVVSQGKCVGEPPEGRTLGASGRSSLCPTTVGAESWQEEVEKGTWPSRGPGRPSAQDEARLDLDSHPQTDTVHGGVISSGFICEDV